MALVQELPRDITEDSIVRGFVWLAFFETDKLKAMLLWRGKPVRVC